MLAQTKGWIVFAFIYGIVLPTAIYSGYQLYITWNEQYVVKRRRIITLWMFILGTFDAIIPPSTIIFDYLTGIPFAVETVAYICFNIVFSGVCILMILRVYILYYDHKYNHVLAMNKWQIMIDPSVEKNNWFLLNKKTYGNYQYVTLRIILPIAILYISLFLFLRFIFDRRFIRRMVRFVGLWLTLLVTVIIGFTIWRKYPKATDTLLIRNEIKLYIKISICGGLPVLFMMAMFNALGIEMYYLCVCLLGFVWVAFVLSLTMYPQKCDNYVRRRAPPEALSEYTPWTSVITSEEGYEAFANFLENEFSIENLLFITEYIHLKSEIINNEILNDNIIKELDLDYTVKLPKSIPLSLIAKEFKEKCIENEISIYELCYDAMEKLFCKYIDSSTAVMEVNIASHIRIDLTNAFRNGVYAQHKVKHSMRLMENAVKEISFLINDSNSRFRQKTVFFALQDLQDVTN